MKLAAAIVLGHFGACAATRTDVVMKTIDERTALIFLGPGDVKVGDTVSLLNSRCASGPHIRKTRRPASLNCQEFSRGEGTVTKLVNDRISGVTFPAGLDFEEGDAVRPLKP